MNIGFWLGFIDFRLAQKESRRSYLEHWIAYNIIYLKVAYGVDLWI